jgi:hypothetical protein
MAMYPDIPFHCLVEIFGIYLFYNICSIFITYNTALKTATIFIWIWSCWEKELVYRLNAEQSVENDCRKPYNEEHQKRILEKYDTTHEIAIVPNTSVAAIYRKRSLWRPLSAITVADFIITLYKFLYSL